MKKQLTKYIISHKSDPSFLEKVIYEGHENYRWILTDKIELAYLGTEGHMRNLLTNSDFEIKQIKITYEF